MKLMRLSLIAAIAGLAAGAANAALLDGVVQYYPDVTLNTNYIIYDHNGIDADTGLFRVVSMGSTLNAASGGTPTPQTQSYAGIGDSLADVMLSVQINNVTGVFEGGTVSIGFGNNTANPRFSWQGYITNFGYLDNGTQFNARWAMASDQYQNMPANYAQFVNNYLTSSLGGKLGGINITNSAGFGTLYSWASALGKDWVFGTGVTATSTPANIAPFVVGLDAANLRIQSASTVQADAFVPIPGALWLMLSGLGMIASFARRKSVAAA
jgi:hypothetical protein